MAEKRENSVLFSLRELRQIEDDRVKSEEQAVRDREAAERAQKAAEIQRQKDEEERKRREIEDAERAKIEAEERIAREHRLRVEVEERKAQVDAQARLEEQRLKLEIDAKAREASTRKARILVAASAGLFVIAIGSVLLVKWSKDREAAATARAQQEEKARIAEHDRTEALKKQWESESAASKKLDDENKQLLAELNKAQSAAEVKRINDQIARNNEAKAAHAAEMERIKVEQAKAPVRVNADCTGARANDPLCGLR
jgi:hypothetical protein